jgi:hypothetical protein
MVPADLFCELFWAGGFGQMVAGINKMGNVVK